MNLAQAIKTLEEWETLCRHNDDGTDEDSRELGEAIRIALQTMQAAAKEEKRRDIKGAFCGNCGRWKRDYSTKAGGSCPIPVHGLKGPKYRSRASKACMNYIQKSGEGSGNDG